LLADLTLGLFQTGLHERAILLVFARPGFELSYFLFALAQVPQQLLPVRLNLGYEGAQIGNYLVLAVSVEVFLFQAAQYCPQLVFLFGEELGDLAVVLALVLADAFQYLGVHAHQGIFKVILALFHQFFGHRVRVIVRSCQRIAYINFVCAFDTFLPLNRVLFHGD